MVDLESLRARALVKAAQARTEAERSRELGHEIERFIAEFEFAAAEPVLLEQYRVDREIVLELAAGLESLALDLVHFAAAGDISAISRIKEKRAALVATALNGQESNSSATH